MNTKKNYNTKQKQEIISYLEKNSGHHITINDVFNYFKSKSVSVGQTTIYRHLESLVDEGIVKKYIFDNNTPACFEYVNENAHIKGDTCFHLKCEKCGMLIHLQCDELKQISSHIEKEHNFVLDTYRTVLYGLCESCRN